MAVAAKCKLPTLLDLSPAVCQQPLLCSLASCQRSPPLLCVQKGYPPERVPYLKKVENPCSTLKKLMLITVLTVPYVIFVLSSFFLSGWGPKASHAMLVEAACPQVPPGQATLLATHTTTTCLHSPRLAFISPACAIIAVLSCPAPGIGAGSKWWRRQ